MPDQQDMQAYVRGRLAGTQPPPQPAQDPMQSYILAQGALGSRVPADTMTDSPQFLQNPGVTPGPVPQSDEDQAEDALFAQKDQLFKQIDAVHQQMHSLPLGSPAREKLYQQWSDMVNQVDQLSNKFDAGPTGQWARRQGQIQDNAGDDAAAIQGAMQDRRRQPRQPLPPPAPGGVPYAPAPSPVVPQLPATAGLTS